MLVVPTLNRLMNRSTPGKVAPAVPLDMAHRTVLVIPS
jgi:hypothetical protein